MTPPTVIEYEDETPRREKGAWMRVAAVIVASVALGVGIPALAGMLSHENRMTTVESDTKNLKESDHQIKSDMKEMKDDFKSDLKEIKELLKEMRGRR